MISSKTPNLRVSHFSMLSILNKILILLIISTFNFSPFDAIYAQDTLLPDIWDEWFQRLGQNYREKILSEDYHLSIETLPTLEIFFQDDNNPEEYDLFTPREKFKQTTHRLNVIIKGDSTLSGDQILPSALAQIRRFGQSSLAESFPSVNLFFEDTEGPSYFIRLPRNLKDTAAQSNIFKELLNLHVWLGFHHSDASPYFFPLRVVFHNLPNSMQVTFGSNTLEMWGIVTEDMLHSFVRRNRLLPHIIQQENTAPWNPAKFHYHESYLQEFLKIKLFAALIGAKDLHMRYHFWDYQEDPESGVLLPLITIEEIWNIFLVFQPEITEENVKFLKMFLYPYDLEMGSHLLSSSKTITINSDISASTLELSPKDYLKWWLNTHIISSKDVGLLKSVFVTFKSGLNTAKLAILNHPFLDLEQKQNANLILFEYMESIQSFLNEK